MPWEVWDDLPYDKGGNYEVHATRYLGKTVLDPK